MRESHHSPRVFHAFTGHGGPMPSFDQDGHGSGLELYFSEANMGEVSKHYSIIHYIPCITYITYITYIYVYNYIIYIQNMHTLIRAYLLTYIVTYSHTCIPAYLHTCILTYLDAYV